ncbi:MerR family transcriptional regulator [Candidatus Leptofilum sp.]|uniref:MerR family transcriptional regulator n=1 Tax=Candidatus Leptofilum sp. TaxID=3241576 RepID=UPI003B5B3EEA
MEQQFTIRQAAEKMGVTAYTLRYYEEIGILPGIQRNGSGHRFYDEQDLGWIGWIKLLRSSGMPIETIREFVQLTQSGNDSIPARCEILDAHRQKIRSRIDELQGFLVKLDDKLQFYQGLED